jgi:hypothetical protein
MPVRFVADVDSRWGCALFARLHFIWVGSMSAGLVMRSCHVVMMDRRVVVVGLGSGSDTADRAQEKGQQKGREGAHGWLEVRWGWG